MPRPPRLLLSSPLLPLLTVVILSSTSPPIPASALSYGDGQPEYPSQPELTSDRDALARIFIQGLMEKEGKSRIPHGYASREESDAWVGNGRSLKRSDGTNSNGQRNLISLQDVYPRILHEKAYADIGGIENAPEGQDEGFLSLDPLSEKERIVSELLARGHPSYTGHRLHGFVDPPQLSGDPYGQKLKLKELLRVVMGNDEIPTEFLRDYDERHGTRPPLKEGDWSVGGGGPYPFGNKKTGGGDDDGVWGRSSAAKRDPFGINARGFHDDVFNRDFGSFNPMKRVARNANEYTRKEEDERRELERAERQLGSNARINGSSDAGTDNDVVSRRVKRSTVDEASDPKPLPKPDTTLPDKAKGGGTAQIPLNREERAADDGKTTESNRHSKRRPEMDSSGFHGDTFNSGFGDFWTMKRNIHHQRPSGFLVAGSLAKRRPEMDSSGFHGDTFNSGFGDFWTMKRMVDGVYPPGYDRDGVSSVGKRRPEMDSSGFHGDTFSSGFGDFYTMKRNPSGGPQWADKEKRRPEMDSSGFHGDTFNSGFGDFWTMKRTAQAHPLGIPGKRRPEMDSSGFHGDTFNSGFGDFWTMKRNALAHPLGATVKRRPEMDSSGFHGDTFNGGFGDFWTMKRDGVLGAANALRGSRMQNGRTGEDWDAEGEDEYDGLDAGKRRPEMDSSGFHGDTFNSGFGDFWTMKRGQPNGFTRTRREVGTEVKRRPEMDASGFHGDTFSNGFGDFWTLKRSGGGENFPPRWVMGRLESKRRPEMDSSGFHGDTFNGGFGDFWTMKRSSHLVPYPARFANSKRRPEMDSSGFHGDTFDGGFGDFWTMKRGEGFESALPGRGSLLHPSKRKPEMDSSGFHGDTFNGGFGDFWTMKRGSGGRDDGRTKQESKQTEGEEDKEAKESDGFGGSPGVYGVKEGEGDSGEKVIGEEKEGGGESGDGSGKSEAKGDDIKN